MAGFTRDKVQTARRRGHSNRLIAEINVTPFVDVTLVLLIIFMVAAPLLTVGVSIDLPKTSATPLPNEQEEPLTITLTETGNLWLQKTEVEFADLDNKLKSILAERNNDKIFFYASSACPLTEFNKACRGEALALLLLWRMFQSTYPTTR